MLLFCFQIEELEAKIKQLEDEIEELRNKIGALEELRRRVSFGTALDGVPRCLQTLGTTLVV